MFVFQCVHAFEPHNTPERYFKVLIEVSTLEPDNLGLSLALPLPVWAGVCSIPSLCLSAKLGQHLCCWAVEAVIEL